MCNIQLNNKGIETTDGSTSNIDGPWIIDSNEISGISKSMHLTQLNIQLRCVYTSSHLIYHDQQQRDQDYMALVALLKPNNILAVVSSEALMRAHEDAAATRGKPSLKLSRTTSTTTKKEPTSEREPSTSSTV